jgi:hypothetical protein
MVNALREAKRQLQCGANPEVACRAAKRTAGFSGSMRVNLVAMLDHFAINKWLGIGTCHELFRESADNMVQATSLLRYPVFRNGSNYNGSPDALKSRLLRRYVLDYFAKEAMQLRDATFIPLGETVSRVVEWLAAEGVIEGGRLLSGFPHPSEANNERISHLLGKKPKAELSNKTDAGKIDEARARIQTKVGLLGPASGAPR